MEYWSTGVLEYWSTGVLVKQNLDKTIMAQIAVIHYSSTPVLQQNQQN
jgi:hypothetical protein